MKRAFQIYKEGFTNTWVWICIPNAEYTEELVKAKAEKYFFLGYQVKF